MISNSCGSETRRPNVRYSTGFTLVEVLVVIAIIGVLAGITTSVIASVGQTAKQSRTKAIIAVCNDVILNKMESFKNRPLAVSVPDFAVANRNASDGSTSGTRVDGTVEVPPREAARARLMMIRDLMRMELPDRKDDILENASRIEVAAVFQSYNGSNVISSAPFSSVVTWANSGLMESYRDRVPTDPNDWTDEYESSECLYLVLSTSFAGGISALSSIPSTNIGDLDVDGMPEILDGWGVPIGFIRWPVGYEDASAFPIVADENDPFHVDWGYVASNAPDAHPMPPASFNAKTPFSLQPLIISGGADGKIGIRSRSDTASFSYRDMTWPTAQMGSESAGRSASYRFIDPYQRQFSSGGLIGESLPDTPEGDEQRADNITNQDLMGSI